MPAGSKRIGRVLHLVDELELDPAELRALRDEIDARQECLLDLDAAKTDDERELAVTIKQRIDAHARGAAELVPISNVMKVARDEVRRLQGERRRRASR